MNAREAIRHRAQTSERADSTVSVSVAHWESAHGSFSGHSFLDPGRGYILQGLTVFKYLSGSRENRDRQPEGSSARHEKAPPAKFYKSLSKTDCRECPSLKLDVFIGLKIYIVSSRRKHRRGRAQRPAQLRGDPGELQIYWPSPQASRLILRPIWLS